MAQGHTDNHSTEIKNPGSWKLESSTRGIFIGMAVVGIVGLVASIILSPVRGWSALLMNHFFFMSLALGGLFITSIQYVTNAMWSAPVRRIAESFSAYLPVVLVGFLIICLGIPHLFSWSHSEIVQGDPVLEHKASYLNVTFFVIRNLVAIAVWFLLGRKLVGNSVAQDADGNPVYTLRNRVLSGAFIVLFALTYTMSSIDLLMSLDPHWFSTMFGVYAFAGLFTSSLALLTIFTIVLLRKGLLKGIVNDNHLHDLGKFMFAFTIFWAYIAFSQYMLIWYANLPEETMYFMHRFDGGWKGITIFLLLGKFLVPFFALLPREAKRDAGRLMKVAIWILFAQWIDLIWIIQPEFFKDGPKIGFPEVAGLLAFGGIFCLMVTRFLGTHNIVAIKDPKLAESVLHHHQ
ncbi:MAG: hypothetical protein H7301_04075 [Cryobacterium sp.]|nr:hypothetical protein [Oligoflexia bacterium]